MMKTQIKYLTNLAERNKTILGEQGISLFLVNELAIRSLIEIIELLEKVPQDCYQIVISGEPCGICARCNLNNGVKKNEEI